MKLLDANVLLAAHRADHSHFDVARPWLTRLVGGVEPFGVPDLVAGTFVRVATHRRVFAVPTTLDAAFDFLRALRGAPGHVHVGPGPDHLGVLRSVCIDADARGDLVPDAQLVALAAEHAADIVSFDRDFARFDTVRWIRPSA